MRLGVKAGLTQPAIIMRNSASQAEAQVIDDPKESEFYILAREREGLRVSSTMESIIRVLAAGDKNKCDTVV